MHQAILPDIDLAVFQRVIEPRFFARGGNYARQHAVVRMEWDRRSGVLAGSVRNRSGDFYQAHVYFGKSGRSLAYLDSDCDCPVGFACKHVVALVLTAKGITGQDAPAGPVPVPWEQSLGSLLRTSSAEPPNGVPLAVELSLSPGTGRAAPRLLGRLVRPGKNGWVSGGLSWNGLGSRHYYGEYLESHVRIVQELYAVYRSRNLPSYYYSHEEKSIDISAFESPRLWALLAEAEAAGVRLVHAKKRLGNVEQPGSAEVCLDARHDESGALVITPSVRVDGIDAEVRPILFIGEQGHGLVYTVGAGNNDDHPLRLARLDRPVPPQLQHLTLENERLEIPGDEEGRFRDEYYPRVRRLATVTSSDGSFTPPVISEPTLTLIASYGDDHDVDLNWEWAYQVGDARRSIPLQHDHVGGEYRDHERERAILADLGSLAPELAPREELRGIGTMRFTTEMLPLLREQPGVAVEIQGAPPEYREVSDSVEIHVSTDEISGETDWFDLGIAIAVEGREVPFVDVFTALSREETHLLLPDGAYFSLDKPELRSLRKLIEEARTLQDAPGGGLRISRFQADLWAELAALGVVDRQAKSWQRQVEGLLSIDTVEVAEPPTTLAATLRPYQLDGFRWLAFLWEYQLGGILADDMGLGKTLQALALICHAKQRGTGSPFLIVAPTSVVSNWATEAARFAPDLQITAVSDTLRRRGQTLDEVMSGADVVVTSYTLFRLDFDHYAQADWAGLVLDEAQQTKNHHSKIYQCTRRLPAPFKLAITGTPMENNLMELWSLLSITAPGLFPNPSRFLDYYARPIEKRGETELLAQLRRRIKPLVKRRTKEQVVADLPAKQEQIFEVDLHPRHRTVYQRQLQRERQKVLGLIDDMQKNRFTILRSLTLLRQLSLHAGLVDDKHRNLPSAKIDALVEQLGEVLDGGHRALVFSQFTGFLDLVRAQLDANGVPYCYLDGKTRNRASVLKRFKEGSVPVFLISLKAGGFGLNLTEADYCFLLDPWWNPATEAQAVDRTHRIGQTRKVMVYRFVARDTIEEKVTALKARKADLFASVMDDGNVFGSSLDADDVRELLA